MRKMLIALALLASLALPATAQEVAGAHWTMTRLDVDVYPDFAGRTFRVVGTARLRLDGAERSAGPTLRLGHDLSSYHPTQTEFMTFTSVLARGRPTVTLNRTGDVRGLVYADIRFARPKRRGQSVEIRFETRMAQPSFTGVVTDRVAVASSGTGWYPTPLTTEAETRDDASIGVTRIHLPRDFYSFSTGAFVSRREGGETIETWRKDGTRTRGFVAGAYRRATRQAAGIDVYIYSLTPAMDADALSQQVGVLAESLARRYGAFPYHQYAAAEISNDAVRWWGLADGDYQVLRTSLVEIGGVFPLAHEMAHAWWGNLIEPEWPGGYMLSEAMAEYSAMIAYGDVHGPDAFREALALRRTVPGTPPDYTMPHFFDYLSRGEVVPLSQTTPSGTNYEVSVVKGARVLHMLRMRVGDDVFFGVMRQVLRDHAHGNLALGAWRAAFEAAAPDMDLPRFFEQWLDRPGAPAFGAEIECTPSATEPSRHRVTVRQLQSGEPYALDLDLRLSAEGGGEALAVAQVRDRETQIEITASQCLDRIEFNPARDLFIWREEYGNRPN